MPEGISSLADMSKELKDWSAGVTGRESSGGRDDRPKEKEDTRTIGDYQNDKINPLSSKDKKQIKDVAKTIESTRSFLEQKVSEKESIPNYTDIARIQEASVSKDRVELIQRLIQRGFEDTGNTIENPRGGDPKLVLNNFEELTDLSFEVPGALNSPDVFVKQITNRRGKDSGEALVVVRMNNSDNPAENVVAIMAVPFSKGELRWQNYGGLLNTYSEEKFKEVYDADGSSASQTLESRFVQGKVTTSEYTQKYKKINRKTLSQRWQEHDKNVVKGPDANALDYNQQLKAREDVRRDRDEALAGLRREYTTQLEELREKEVAVIEAVEKQLKEVAARNREILNSEFKKLYDAQDDTPKGIEAKNRIKRMARKAYPNVTAAELNALFK